MALPIRPHSNSSGSAPSASVEEGLPLPALPKLEPTLPRVTEPTRAPSPTPAVTESPAERRAPAPEKAPAQESDPNWTVDPVTGKRYKRIAGYKEGVMKSKAAMSKAANGGMTLDQLRATVNEEPDLDLDNLNGSAEIFLAHLRVPPNKEEQQALRKERAEREKLYEAAAKRAAAEEESKEGN